MGFKPTPGAYYHIIARHSGKPLGVKDKSRTRGATIQQQSFVPDEESQQFRFDVAPGHRYYVKPRTADLFFDVSGNSAADGADICVWTWNAGTPNQQFQFISAGGGYYYIVAANSGKYFDVYGKTNDDGARVVQHTGNEGHNQQFKIIPAGQIYSDIESLPFVVEDTSGKLKDLVAGIAGNVPEVGSALKGMVQFFWPTSGMNAVWQQLKTYVDALVKDLISRERVIELEKKLDGIRKTILLYQETSLGSPQKGQYFTNVLSSIAQAEPYFFDPRDPQKVLTYFVALGTIHLTMLREQVLFYKEIYGTDDTDKAQHLKTLKDKITAYKAAADKVRAKALEWRLDLIKLEYSEEHPWGIAGPSTTEIWTVRDGFDGSGPSWRRNTLTGGDSDPKGNAEREFNRRKSLVKDQYSAELDSFLAAAYLWPYLDPTNPDKPKRKSVVTADGFYGGVKATAFDDNPNGKPITKIVVHAGSRVDGVEVFYGDNSGGLHGWRGGSTHTLELKPGESVVGVYGRSGAVLDSLYFETDRGRIVGGGGGGGGGEWRADPPEGTDATLMKISGFQGTKHIEGIKLHWQYWRDE